jgi:transcription antitermination factor NusA-like protein
LAIGRGGQNVRLAARLTGWKINVTEEGGGMVEETEKIEEIKNSDEENETPEAAAV